MKPKSIAAVKSANRALDILEYVADATEPPTFSQLLTALGFPRSSLFHLLTNLLARGYLEQEGAGGRYRLGPRLGQLATQLQGPTLLSLVLPHLRTLSDALNETSGFNVRIGDAVEAVATVIGRQALTFTMKVSERAPLYAVSSGKIVLARMSPTELDAYFDRVSLQPITAQTLQSKSALRREIAAARREGFAYSHEEFTPGITGIATAVEKNGQLLGMVNLAVPTARFTEGQAALFRRELRSAAAALGQALRLETVQTYAPHAAASGAIREHLRGAATSN